MHIRKSNGEQTDLKFLGNLKASEEYSWRSFSGFEDGIESGASILLSCTYVVCV